jgi:hypothetical protein
MIIRRKVNARFTVVPNEPINDEALTFEALGLLAYLLSRPDNWQVKVNQLRIRGGLGRDKAQALMRQLIDTGYVRRQSRAENSKQFKDWEYIVYDCPQLQKDDAKPEPENPVAADKSHNNRGVTSEPQPEKPEPEKAVALIKTDLTKFPYGEADASRKVGVEASTSSQIWDEALSLFFQCPLSEPQKRTLIGKWQKRTPTELAKKELLAAVRAAAKAGTPDPVSYVEAALRKYPVPPDPSTFSLTDWQRNLQAAIKTKQWPPNWGPPPGKRGCRVPADLIKVKLLQALGERRAAA